MEENVALSLTHKRNSFQQSHSRIDIPFGCCRVRTLCVKSQSREFPSYKLFPHKSNLPLIQLFICLQEFRKLFLTETEGKNSVWDLVECSSIIEYYTLSIIKMKTVPIQE